VDQETVVQEAIVDAVVAAINLMRLLGLILPPNGDVRHQTQRRTRNPELARFSSEALEQEDASCYPDADTCRIYVYIFGCKGCAKLGKRLKTKVYKIGSTIEQNLETRLKQIGKEQYGAWSGQGSELAIEDGFSDWVALPIATSRLPIDHNVTLLPRAIQIDLPHTMTRRAFDAELQTALAPRALHRQKTATSKRLTQYSMGGASRLSQARELYEFSPNSKADGDMLLGGIEAILSNHCQDRI
jgi:hypothetical protein